MYNLNQVILKKKIVYTTRFWNNLHQVRSKSTRDWNNLHQVRSKPNIFFINMGARKP